MSLVSVVRVRTHNHEGIKEAIKKSLDLVHFTPNIDRIIIKPNMCYYYHPSTGEVTDPQFVSALIDVLRENSLTDPEVFIVESDASAMKCKYIFKMLGYDKMAEEKSVRLVNLSLEESSVAHVEVNGSHLEFRIPKILCEPALVVNVPKMKYMNDVKITCALKNMYGCNAVPRKSVYHKTLNEAIVGINKLIKTSLVVVDGLIVHGKNTKRLDMVMSGRDPVAVDSIASNLMGISPRSVRQIVLASEEGVGSLKSTLVGDFSYFRDSFPKKRFKDNVRKAAVSLYSRVFRRDFGELA